MRSQALDGVFRPTSIAVSDEGVWVADASVLRLDPASGGTVAAIAVGDQARSRLLAANGELWAAVVEDEVAQGRILRISTVDDRIAAASQVGPATAAVTPFAGALWSLDVVGGAVRRLDPATLEELAVYQLRDASARVLGVEITAYADAIWAAFVDGVVRVDPATGEVLSDTASTVGEVATMAAGSGAVWAISTRVLDDRAVLQRLDPVTGRFSGRPLATGAPAYAMATGGGAVWIADSAGTVSRVVPT